MPELVALIRDVKPRLVINVALPYQDLAIMDACLNAGVHYMDTANYEPLDTAKFEYRWQWAYQQRFLDAGASFFVSTSFSKSFSLYGERVGALSVVCAALRPRRKSLSAIFVPARSFSR